MTHSDAADGCEPRPQGPSAAMRLLAVLMLLVPAAGLTVHVILYFWFPQSGEAYLHTRWPMVVAVAAVANLFGNWFHYRRTKMAVDIASRILTYVWILSIVLMLRLAAERLTTG